MSRAVVFNRYGGPEVLEVIEVEPPEPGPNQIRVRVKAAGSQPFDCLMRSGEAHQWIPARFPQRLGNEFAGVIDAVGSGVAEYRVGDEVLGWAMLASHAEHVVAGEQEVVPKPPRDAMDGGRSDLRIRANRGHSCEAARRQRR